MKNKGFTVLYASLIGGLLLAVGAAIANITVEQLTLSAAGRESQFAFYNADTGIECATYLDRASRTDDCPSGLFPAQGDTSNSVPSSCIPSADDITNKKYECLGVSITNVNGDGTSITNTKEGYDPTKGYSGLYSFSIQDTTDNVCFDVNVTHTNSSQTINSTAVNSTSIVSHGYNNCNTTSRFERVIESDF